MPRKATKTPNLPSATTKPNKSRQRGKEGPKTLVNTLVPQPHGGALRPGRPLNPAPGPGRTPNHVRQMAVELGITKALPKLQAIMDDPTSTKGEVIAACREVLGQIPRKDENVLTMATVEQLCQQHAELYNRALEVLPAQSRQLVETRLAELLSGGV